MEWKTITKSSRSRIRSHQTSTKSSEYKLSYIAFPELIQKCKSDQMFIELKEIILPQCIGEIIAVGIGNFSNSLYSTSQQALYELLVQDEKGVLFDPAYNTEELAYLASKEFSVNAGEFSTEFATEKTYFMIHCHFSLYEELLSKEWVADRNVVIIGNSVVCMKEKFQNSTAKENSEKFVSTKVETSDLAFTDTYINKNFSS